MEKIFVLLIFVPLMVAAIVCTLPMYIVFVLLNRRKAEILI